MASTQPVVIAPSPLSKIGLPEWEGRLSDNPDLIEDAKTPFIFYLDSGSRTYRIPFNTPMTIVYADPKWAYNKADTQGRKDLVALKHLPTKTENVIYVRDPKDIESTFNFLTGAAGGITARQTDLYGIVAFDPDDALSRNFEELSLIDALLSPDPAIAEPAKKRLIETRIAAAKKHRESYADLCKVSEERIFRALRLTHNNLIAQWKTNEENKLGKYPPSLSERMGYKVLSKEIAKRDAAHAAAIKIGDEMMARQNVANG